MFGFYVCRFFSGQAVAVTIEGRKKRGFVSGLAFGYSQGMMFWVFAVIFCEFVVARAQPLKASLLMGCCSLSDRSGSCLSLVVVNPNPNPNHAESRDGRQDGNPLGANNLGAPLSSSITEQFVPDVRRRHGYLLV